MDREKIISTFEKIISVCKEDRCDFVDLTFEDAEQILALLKEQEAVKPKSKVRHGANAQIQHFCGNCMTMLHGKPKYCSNCGRPVLWEGR